MVGVSLDVLSIRAMWSFFELDCSLEYPLTFCEIKITLGNLGAVIHPMAVGCLGCLPSLLLAPSADNLRSAFGRTIYIIAARTELSRVVPRAVSFEKNSLAWEKLFSTMVDGLMTQG